MVLQLLEGVESAPSSGGFCTDRATKLEELLVRLFDLLRAEDQTEFAVLQMRQLVFREHDGKGFDLSRENHLKSERSDWGVRGRCGGCSCFIA
jgi:hypothetical protein